MAITSLDDVLRTLRHRPDLWFLRDILTWVSTKDANSLDVTPEQFGAIGTDTPGSESQNNISLQEWADYACSGANLRDGRRVTVTPGSIYRFSQTLSFVPDAATSRGDLDFRGATFRWAGGDTTRIKFGDAVANKKFLDTDIWGLRLEDVSGGFTNAIGVHLEHGDFVRFHGCSVSCSGLYGLYVSGALVTGEGYQGSTNSIGVYNCRLDGAQYGFYGQSNVLRLEGGKYQQNQYAGGLINCASITIEDIDSSINSLGSFSFTGCANARIRHYHERIGSGASGDMNALYRLDNCAIFDIGGNLNCVNGNGGRNKNVAYAVYATNSRSLNIWGAAQRPQVAAVYAENCDGVVVDRAFEVEYSNSAAKGTGPIISVNSSIVNEADGARLRSVVGLTDYGESDFNSWTPTGEGDGNVDGEVTEDTVPGSDGTGSYPVLSMASPLTSGFTYTTSVPSSVASQAIVRFRGRLVDFHEEDRTQRVDDMALVRLLVVNGGVTTQLQYRFTPDWQWFQLVIPSPTAAAFVATIHVWNDPCDVAIESFEIFA